MHSSEPLIASLTSVQARIAQAARQAQRDPQSVHLLAVSKRQSAQAIRALYQASCQVSAQPIIAFGENYVQEALAKQAELQDLPLEWHFIGPIQSNKTREIAQHFTWVHSVDRLKVLKGLAQAARTHAKSLQICLQVNISAEASKSGCAPEEVATLVEAAQAYQDVLCLRGLMCIPAPSTDREIQAQAFARLANLQHQLQQAYSHWPWDTLSMGMSSDLEAAILQGSTWVRIGTALFGARDA
ncbi:hypothetical protein SAMN05421831_1193 [Allopseudospirillum japonicum]|uniref:Pyridoxal phosphate homeostasis protein n=1 Tax=Allopseudospirillum japonicum TaxID=64971 RepID=A0A1H6UV69_9GAMM|nr:YggS family pyridoxal phosphate-dependent enzyme [Allopseudospirillum japonicum]SEI92230.1 hypothetical protein SAMN05421831_1193 [Allopseudospirillum japonicum]